MAKTRIALPALIRTRSAGAAAKRVGKGKCCGTFGELVQGMIGGHHFLVTFPIKRWSFAEFVPDEELSDTSVPEGREKAKAAVEWMVHHFGLPHGHLTIRSDIPVGKGMASSSADIVAAARSVADAFGLGLSPEILSTIAASIEPTDGVMYEGVVAYDHRRGVLLEQLGPLPPIRVIGVDLGGIVDTLSFNRIPKNYTDRELAELSRAYHAACLAVRTGDISLLGWATSLSAEVNQRLLPKPRLDEVMKIARETEAAGVSIAHSGTVIGVLLDRRRPDCGEQAAEVGRKLADLGLGAPFEVPC